MPVLYKKQDGNDRIFDKRISRNINKNEGKSSQAKSFEKMKRQLPRRVKMQKS